MITQQALGVNWVGGFSVPVDLSPSSQGVIISYDLDWHNKEK